MKVLYYIHSLCIGGAETIVVNDLLKLKEEGVDVALVQNSRRNSFLDERLDKAGIHSFVLMPSFNEGIIGAFQRRLYLLLGGAKNSWKKIINEFGPDIIHCHTAANLLKYVDFPASKMVCTIHSDVERNKDMCGAKNYKMLKKLSAGGMTFFSLSEKGSEDIKRFYAPDRIAYVPNGIDLNAIRENKYDRKDFLDSVGIPDNAFVMGHVGRFHAIKNHRKLIEVFNEVEKKHECAYLLLVGTGTYDEIATVKRYVDDFGLGEKVIFMGLRDDANAIMSVFDAFVLPSFSESFSLALVEAQAQGVRCIASDAVPEGVVCNSNCFRLSLDEPSDVWAELVLSDSTHKFVKPLECFDIHTVVRTMVDEYARCVNLEEGEALAR